MQSFCHHLLVWILVVQCAASSWTPWSLWVPPNSEYSVILWFCTEVLSRNFTVISLSVFQLSEAQLIFRSSFWAYRIQCGTRSAFPIQTVDPHWWSQPNLCLVSIHQLLDSTSVPSGCPSALISAVASGAYHGRNISVHKICWNYRWRWTDWLGTCFSMQSHCSEIACLYWWCISVLLFTSEKITAPEEQTRQSSTSPFFFYFILKHTQTFPPSSQ